MTLPKGATKKKGKKPKNKGGRPSVFQDAYVAQAFKLGLAGFTSLQVADFFGVTEKTIYNWQHEHPEFLQSLKKGKDDADADVARSLYERAMGFEHNAVKIFCDKDGTITEAPYVERYPPDTTAAIFWLKNRQPANWRDRKELDVTSKGASLAELLNGSWEEPKHDG